MKDYYKILKVKKSATSKELKDSYRSLKKQYKQSNELLKLEEVEEAYRVLSQEDSREKYDQGKARKKEGEEILEKKASSSKSKLANGVIAVLGIIALVGALFIVSEVANKGGKEMVETKALTTITYAEFKDFLAGSEPTIVMIGRPGCSWCQKYKPILQKVNTTYGLDIKYLNTDDWSQDDYNHYVTVDTMSASEGVATPMTFVIKEGKIVDRIDGYVEQETVESFLKANQIIS